MTTKDFFAERFKYLRKLYGMTNEDVSNAFGQSNGISNVSKSTIEKWASPKGQMPKLETLVQLAKILKTNVDYLCGLSDTMPEDVFRTEVQNKLGLSQKSISSLWQSWCHAKAGYERGKMEHSEFRDLSKVRLINLLLEQNYGLTHDIENYLLLPIGSNSDVDVELEYSYLNSDEKVESQWDMVSEEDITNMYLLKIQGSLIRLKKQLMTDNKDVEFMRRFKQVKENVQKLNAAYNAEKMKGDA